MNIPRLIIAGTQSGVGKTSITLGLAAALSRRGLRVQTFKVGPDYLDPTHLTLASGLPCYNLDGWMTGETYIRDLFARVSAGADFVLIEGVMGLYDGANPAGLEGSTAEIARWLAAPVVLVADAHGSGRSFAATVHGFATFETGVSVGGVVANRTGSARHVEGLNQSLRAASLPPLLGAIPRNALPELPSRHLGLVTADANQRNEAFWAQLTGAIESGIDLNRVLGLARSAPAFTESVNPIESYPIQVRLGIARDEAFHFYYPDNLEALERAGCELVPFSPLHDRELPAGLDGLYIGGGYPEEYAALLSANRTMLESIRKFADGNGTIYAECGGLMYLSEGIETGDGARHGMTGILPTWTRMTKRRVSLGYVEAEFTRDTFWGRAGQRMRSHEFHYSELVAQPTGWDRAYSLHYRRAAAPVPEGFQRGSVLASYMHLHFASHPEAVARFVKRLQASIPAALP